MTTSQEKSACLACLELDCILKHLAKDLCDPCAKVCGEKCTKDKVSYGIFFPVVILAPLALFIFVLIITLRISANSSPDGKEYYNQFYQTIQSWESTANSTFTEQIPYFSGLDAYFCANGAPDEISNWLTDPRCERAWFDEFSIDDFEGDNSKHTLLGIGPIDEFPVVKDFAAEFDYEEKGYSRSGDEIKVQQFAFTLEFPKDNKWDQWDQVQNSTMPCFFAILNKTGAKEEKFLYEFNCIHDEVWNGLPAVDSNTPNSDRWIDSMCFLYDPTDRSFKGGRCLGSTWGMFIDFIGKTHVYIRFVSDPWVMATDSWDFTKEECEETDVIVISTDSSLDQFEPCPPWGYYHAGSTAMDSLGWIIFVFVWLCFFCCVCICVVVFCVTVQVALCRVKVATKKGEAISADRLAQIAQGGELAELKKSILAEDESFDASVLAHLVIDPALVSIQFNDLLFDKFLGQGGSGCVVYSGHWNAQPVAIKSALLTESTSQSSVDEMAFESTTMARLSHPAVLSFFGVCIKLPRFMMVMELCSNGDLKSYTLARDEEERFSVPFLMKKLNWLQEVASGMEYLHSQRLIHRDLKPENVLLDAGLRCKIMDFGLSRVVRTMDQTKTNAIGTALYMAPEMTLGLQYDNSADVFSFAVLAWALMTGNFRPYQGMEYVEMRVANDENFRPLIDETFPGPTWLQQLITRSWAHDRFTRPTFKEIRESISEMKTLPPPGPHLLLYVRDSTMTDSDAEDVVLRGEDLSLGALRRLIVGVMSDLSRQPRVETDVASLMVCRGGIESPILDVRSLSEEDLVVVHWVWEGSGDQGQGQGQVQVHEVAVSVPSPAAASMSHHHQQFYPAPPPVPPPFAPQQVSGTVKGRGMVS